MALNITREAPMKLGSGYAWVQEVDEAGATKSGGVALSPFFIIKDMKMVNKSSTEEATDAGGTKYPLESDASYGLEGTLLSNSPDVDEFIKDTTKYWRLIIEGSRKAKANGKIDYWYFGIVKVSEVSERNFTGTERAIKFTVSPAGTSISYTAPSSGGLTGSKVSTASLAFTQAQGDYYGVKEST